MKAVDLVPGLIIVLVMGLVAEIAAAAFTASPTTGEAETLIDLDIKEGDILDLLHLLAELGDINLVADPELQCRMSLNLKGLAWRQVLDVALRACHWGKERIGKNLIRIAPIEVLRRELEAERRYEEEKKLAGPLRTTYVKLAYASARELAPLLRKYVSPRGDISFDERTNTLIITDVAHR